MKKSTKEQIRLVRLSPDGIKYYTDLFEKLQQFLASPSSDYLKEHLGTELADNAMRLTQAFCDSVSGDSCNHRILEEAEEAVNKLYDAAYKKGILADLEGTEVR